MESSVQDIEEETKNEPTHLPEETKTTVEYYSNDFDYDQYKLEMIDAFSNVSLADDTEEVKQYSLEVFDNSLSAWESFYK